MKNNEISVEYAFNAYRNSYNLLVRLIIGKKTKTGNVKLKDIRLQRYKTKLLLKQYTLVYTRYVYGQLRKQGN